MLDLNETVLKDIMNIKQAQKERLHDFMLDAEGVKLTISLSDQTNNFGQNVSAYVAQTKEQRDAKTPLFYVGNGKTFWSKGETPVPQREQPSQTVTAANDETDLPF